MMEFAGRKRVSGRAALLVTATLAGAVAISTSTSAAEETTPQPVAFGAYVQPGGGQSERSAVEALEAQIGRQLAVVRVFETWEQSFPDSYHSWLRDSGHSIVLSVKPYRADGAGVKWSSIANAAPGSKVDNEIRSWARRVRDYGVPLYVTFHHEPESSTGLGTAEEFIAAWRHWVDVFRAEGATNAKFMWIMTDYSFFVSTSDRRWAPKWYPGDEWVDGIASDAYNWYHCRAGINTAWKSLETIIKPFRDFGALHPDKTLWLTEFGSAIDPARPDRKAQWFDDARELFKQPGWEQFDGVMYFNTYGQRSCWWDVDSTPDSLASFRAMARDPFYSGPVFEDPPPSDDTALLVVGTPTLVAGDVAARDRLTAAGYTVRVLDDDAATGTVSEDLVMISSSVSAGKVGNTYRQTAVPVLIYKPWLYDDMGMASTYGTSSGNSVTITDPASPLAAGRSGTVTITNSSGSIGFGTPAGSADVIATRSGNAVLFAYETGDQLVGGGTAPSCRVALPFSDGALANATSNGTALLDAAVAWAGSC